MKPKSLLRAALCLIGICFWEKAAAQQGGLNQRPTIAPFLNGALPETTPQSIDENGISWELVNAFPNLALPISNPMHLIPVPNNDQLLLLGDQTGKIFSLVNHSGTNQARLLLDLEPVTQYYSDSGLMGMVLHPDYAKPGGAKNFLYVFYRYIPDRNTSITEAYVRISRFSWNPGSNQINPASELVLINQFDSHEWHQGGGMAFGDDGFLYIALGDEGGANDEYNSSQKLNGGMFSGILRIDVDKDPNKSHAIRRQPLASQTEPGNWNEGTYTQNYFIPNDNPWLDPSGGLLEEFYAVGIRNPYRMTRDPVTNQFWFSEVGQDTREEINILKEGANYQWPYLEGTYPGIKPKPPANQFIGEDEGPFYEYGRDVGGCVVGGYVYRGSMNPELYGKYLFTEFNQGRLMVVNTDGNSAATQILSVPPYLALGFGTDHQGELYITMRAEGGQGQPARLLRLQKSPGQGNTNAPPALLSQTNAFSNLSTLAPANGVVPYDVIQPLWSDGAAKRRWLSVPFGNGVYDDKITFSENGNWNFPVGTVLIKHFEFGSTKLETRFTVKGTDHNWYGISYRWNEAGTEAFLLDGQAGLELEFELADGQTKPWYFPSRGECFHCHTASKGRVLGLKTRHLNRDQYYPLTGRTANQLVTLNRAGYFNTTLNNSRFSSMLTAAAVGDSQKTREKRVRSYLDINCSHCHTGNSITRAHFEADLMTPLFWQNLINADPVNSLSISGAKVVRPGDENKSILYRRASSLEGCCAMPPLAKSEVDHSAIALLRDWIQSLNPNEVPQNDVDPNLSPGDIQPPTGSISQIGNTLQLELQFSEPVEGFDPSEFIVSNATVDNVSGFGQSRIISLTPWQPGAPVTLTVPLDSFHDVNGNANDSAIEFHSALVRQSITSNTLPQSVSASATTVTVKIAVTTLVRSDLVVDLQGAVWHGGGRTTVDPGTSVVEVDVPIYNGLTEGDQLRWDIFLTQPGGNWEDHSKATSVNPVTVTNDTVQDDHIEVVSVPGRVSPGDSAVVVVDYRAIEDGFVHISLIADDGTWLAGSTEEVTAGAGSVPLVITIPAGLDSMEFSYESYLSTQAWDWQNARVWGQLVDADIISNWTAGFGLTGDDALFTADTDQDFINLKQEYGYNLNPQQNDQRLLTPGVGTSGLPLIRLVEGRLQIEYIRRRSDTSLSYRPQFSNHTDGFEDATEGEIVTVIDRDFERVVISDSETTATAPCRFGRIIVE